MAGENIRGLTIAIGGKIDDFLKSMKQVDKEINDTTKLADKLARSLNVEWNDKTFSELQKLQQRALDDTIAKAEMLRKEIALVGQDENLSKSPKFQKLQNELTNTEAEAVFLKKKLEEINDLKIEHIANQFKKVGDSISDAGKKLIGLSATAAAALAGMTAIFNSSVTSAAQLNDLSQSVNMSAEALQRWRYIAMQLGVDNTTLQTALTKTQSAFANLAQGKINASSEALLRLGFSAEQAAQGMDANFEEMILRLSQVTDATEQAYMANELFGDRLGSRIIPLLNGGAEGLAQLTREFEEMGYMSNEQVKALAAYNDQWNRIKQSFTEIKNQVAASLLPLMQSMTDFIQNRVVPAIKTLSDWFNGLSDGSKSMIATLLTIVAALAPVLLLIGKLTSSIGPLLTGFKAVHGLLGSFAGLPVVGWIAGIVALVTTLYATNEQFRESINNLVGTLMSALMPVLETVGELFGMLLNAIMPLVQSLGNVLIPIIQMLSNILNPIIQVLVNLLGPIMNQLKFAFNMIQVQLAPLIQLLNVLGGVLTWLNDVWQWVFGEIIKFMNPILGTLESWINGAIDMLNGLIEAINSLGGWLGISLGKLDHIKLQIESGAAPSQSSSAPSVNESVDNAIANTNINNSYNNTTSYDNSNKTINFSLVVQNYAERMDVDYAYDQFKARLAKEF